MKLDHQRLVCALLMQPSGPLPLLAIIPLRLNFLRAFLHFLPNFCLKLILQLATSTSLQTPEEEHLSVSSARKNPFSHSYRPIIQLERHAKRFVVSSDSRLSSLRCPIYRVPFIPSSVFPSRAAALTSDFLEWEALRLHRVIRFHEGTLKFKSPADRLFFLFFPTVAENEFTLAETQRLDG